MHDTFLPGNSRNRHPVDRLADIRARIKALSDEETDLKAKISVEMGTADSLGGDEFIARQVLQERKGALDEKAIAKALGLDNLDAYRKPASAFILIKTERCLSEVA